MEKITVLRFQAIGKCVKSLKARAAMGSAPTEKTGRRSIYQVLSAIAGAWRRRDLVAVRPERAGGVPAGR